MRILATMLALLCGLAVVLPASASAWRLTIPPNQAEADEYTEGVPDGRGNSAPDRARDPDSVLSQNVLDKLNQLGEQGADVAALASSTAPPEPRGGSGSGSDRGGAGSGSASGAAAAGSAASSTTEAGNLTAASYVPSEDGLGSWLWIIVAIAAVGAAGYALNVWMKGRRT